MGEGHPGFPRWGLDAGIWEPRDQVLAEVLFGVFPAVDRKGRHAESLDGVVVPLRVEAVADKEHVVERDAAMSCEFLHAVRLVDALARNVDARRAAGAHFEVGELRLDAPPEVVLLGAGRIPPLLGVDRGVLPEGAEGDLRPAVLEDRSPRVGLPVPGGLGLALDGCEGPLRLVFGEVLGVLQDPGGSVVAVVASSTCKCAAWQSIESGLTGFPAPEGGRPNGRARTGREEVQVGQVEVIALLQRVDKLVFKLVKVAARDDRDGDEAEQASERVDHARVQRGLARRERVIEIERDQARSGHAVCGYGRR